MISVRLKTHEEMKHLYKSMDTGFHKIENGEMVNFYVEDISHSTGEQAYYKKDLGEIFSVLEKDIDKKNRCYFIRSKSHA